MELLQSFPRQRDDLAARVLGDEAVVVTPRDQLVHELDEVATFVWQLCDGRHRGTDIVARLTSEFEVDEATAAAELARLLALLRDRGLVELRETPVE